MTAVDNIPIFHFMDFQTDNKLEIIRFLCVMNILNSYFFLISKNLLKL